MDDAPAQLRRALVLAAATAVLVIAAPAGAQDDTSGRALEHDGFVAQLDADIALINDAPEASIFLNAFGYSARAGWRFGDWGVFGQLGQELWVPVRDEDHWVRPGVLNVGVGAEALFVDHHVRVSAAAGTSTLLYDTPLDAAGTTGYFIDIVPAGLRWPLSDRFVAEFDPFTFTLSQPVLDEPALVQTEFKAAAVLEFSP